jgi:hypothetical protein
VRDKRGRDAVAKRIQQGIDSPAKKMQACGANMDDRISIYVLGLKGPVENIK